MERKTVRQLRQEGNKVRVTHFRNHKTKTISFADGRTVADQVQFSRKNHKQASSDEISQFGGATVVQVTTPDGLTGEGEVHCHYKDPFCYREGANRATFKALQDIAKQRGADITAARAKAKDNPNERRLAAMPRRS